MGFIANLFQAIVPFLFLLTTSENHPVKKSKYTEFLDISGIAGYVEISEKLSGHCQLVEWEIFICLTVLTEKENHRWYDKK